MSRARHPLAPDAPGAQVVAEELALLERVESLLGRRGRRGRSEAAPGQAAWADAGYQLQIPRMFAAVFLISAAGVLIFVLLTGLSRLALGRWHESEIEAEG